MPLNTISAATQITPVVISTFFQHFHRKLEKDKSEKDNDPSNDILFDQAFHIVRKFIDICTLNDVESIQAFTNTHIPSPPWSITLNVVIPLTSCHQAADLLIKWFEPENILRQVGGERWWQVRGLDGIEAEWVTMRGFMGPAKIRRGKDIEDITYSELNKLQRVMLYIHGGAFYWGSINTHRYQILRMARKIGGRCFAVNYRKAPQYPFPCAVQDVLAAYLYLIQPPAGAKHTAIDSKRIVVAGDSAGGNLTLSLLTLIRDLDLPMPAGAILISPWVDLTHSFPSVIGNTNTDIIPKYGFIHKPSALWPMPAIAESAVARATRPFSPTPVVQEVHAQSVHDLSTVTGEDISQLHVGRRAQNDTDKRSSIRMSTEETRSIELGQPVQVEMTGDGSEPLELRSQIQLYATNDQLTHPLVSPLLQGSLGGFCPLYILAGDHEVLRDEIVYLAHRAANPREYPLRQPLLDRSERQRTNVDRFSKPTQVHLQIFDGMPHVMTVYSFYHPVKYAYRSIAAFAIHVIDRPVDVMASGPFPDPEDTAAASDTDSDTGTDAGSMDHVRKSSSLPQQAKEIVKDVAKDAVLTVKRATNQSSTKDDDGASWRNRSVFVEFPCQNLVGERVDLRGDLRPLEAPECIASLQIPVNEIGIIKERPARRYLEGQEKWDKVFRRKAETVVKRRIKMRKKVARLLERAREEGLLDGDSKPIRERSKTPEGEGSLCQRRWGPLDLEHEFPPPSAVALRRDIPDSLTLIKRSLLQAKPGTAAPSAPEQTKSRALARMKAIVSEDNPQGPIVHSAAEKQVHPTWLPMHGLSIWASIMKIFSTEARKKHRKMGKPGKTESTQPSQSQYGTST